jgi:putative oxidoreductase
MAIAVVAILGRVTLAALFVLAGISKFVDPVAVRAHMEQERVPGSLLYLVAVFEVAAGIALAVGWNVAIAAAALSLFCLCTAFFIHLHLSDRIERTQFVKDIALAGALATIAGGALS